MELATCHPNRKAKTRGLCGSCYDKWLRENNPQYKIKQRENYEKWKLENPEKYKRYKENTNKKKREFGATPEGKLFHRNRSLQDKYGISVEEYDKILASQNYGCAICGRKETTKKLHVDHCHITNKVRGILCHQCNWYMGTIDSDPTIIEKIISYRNKK